MICSGVVHFPDVQACSHVHSQYIWQQRLAVCKNASVKFHTVRSNSIDILWKRACIQKQVYMLTNCVLRLAWLHKERYVWTSRIHRHGLPQQSTSINEFGITFLYWSSGAHLRCNTFTEYLYLLAQAQRLGIAICICAQKDPHLVHNMFALISNTNKACTHKQTSRTSTAKIYI